MKKKRSTIISVQMLMVILLLLINALNGYSQSEGSPKFQKELLHAESLATARSFEKLELFTDSILNLKSIEVDNYEEAYSTLYYWSFVAKSHLFPRDTLYNILQEYHRIIDTLNINREDGEEHARLSLQYSSLFHNDLEQDSVLNYLDQAESYLGNIDQPSIVRLRIFFMKGRLAYNRFDFPSQITHLKQGLTYQETYFPENHLNRIFLCNGIGIGYRNLGEPESALDYFEKGLETPAHTVMERNMHATIYNNMGLTYSDTKMYPECIEAIHFALAYYEDYIGNEYHEIGSGYDNLGMCYLNNGEEEMAVQYFRKSLSFMENYLPQAHRDFTLPYLSLGQVHFGNNELDSSAYYFDLAFKNLLANGWTRKHPYGAFIMEDAFDVFKFQIELEFALFVKTREQGHLHRAVEYMEDFIHTGGYSFSQLNSIASIENYINRYESVYNTALNCLYELYRMDPKESYVFQAISWIEKYKSIEMKRAFQRSQVEWNEGYKKLNRQYKILVDSLQYFEHLRGGVNTENDSIDQLLFQAEYQLDLWKEKVRKQHPEYYNLVYNVTDSLFEVREYLDTQSMAIFYKMGRDVLFILTIDDRNSGFYRVADVASLVSDIDIWRNSILDFGRVANYDDEQALNLLDIYVSTSRKLYRALIEPLHSSLLPKLVIVPDGSLGHVSFAALLSSNPEDILDIKKYPFLLLSHTISYTYSLGLLKEMADRQVYANGSVLAVAPDYSSVDDEQFKPLEHNIEEAEEIAFLLKGETLQGSSAGSQDFLSACADYRIIHLAAHAQANEQEGNTSFLVFSGDSIHSDIMYTSEMYNLPLHADLVTLSACETGSGEETRVEGIISLARAFSFAGAKSVISTLWHVTDRSTSLLMREFYWQLKDGKPKNSALRAAQVNHIQLSTNAEAHPYYWAGFVLVGDCTPMDFSINQNIVLLAFSAATFFLIIILCFVYHKKASKLLGTGF